MDASERLSLQISLAHAFEGPGALASDLLVSAFCAACKSSRRATVCQPFPAQVVGAGSFDAAAAALDQLTAEDITTTATDTQLRLLQWLLLHLRRAWRVSQASAGDVLQDARTGRCGIPQHMLSQCCCLLRLESSGQPSQPAQPPRQRLAFHGTDFCSLHGILQHHLLSASGTRLQATGAAFGHGIYLSTDLPTSFAFSTAREGWRGSGIGRYLRCVLVCGVDEAAVRHGEAAGARRLPDTYVVVERPSDVWLKYLLVYRDDALLGHFPRQACGSRSSSSGGRSSGGGGRRQLHAVDACWLMTAAYVCFMLLLAAWKGAKALRL